MPVVGRFAPSPSGPLHFGSLVAALASYCQCRSQQGQWLLRIEDVDTPRVVKGAAARILHDLETFGFEWHGEILYQSKQTAYYQQYLDQLLRQDFCYACECSRKTLREQAVRSGPLGQIYPGNCRAKRLDIANRSIRIDTRAASSVEFTDQRYGPVALNIPAQVGDFVLKRVDNVFAYHLAVVVDDQLQGINEVVRGADLLTNTCLHIYLQQCLGFPAPAYLHVPLVENPPGIKLSKQTGARALDPARAPQLLHAALTHLGQQPPHEFQDNVAEILAWAIAHWNPDRIPVTSPTRAETLDGAPANESQDSG